MSDKNSAPNELLSELAKIIQEGKKSKTEKFKEKYNVEIGADDFLGELVKLQKDFADLEEKLPDLVIEEPIVEPIQENIPVPENEETWAQRAIDEDDLVQKSAEHIKKRVNEVTNLFSVPPAETYPTTLKLVQKRIELLEQWLYKVSAEGPGGGAGEIYNLDMPTRQVTGNYTIQRKDYYVGVNANVKSYITLPSTGANVKDGRIVIIKDESGHAQLTPIKIVGNIDNDPNGAEIRINNGAIQLLYRNGSWRVV